MPYGLQVTVPPSAEPVALDRAKRWCRVDFPDDDDDIADLITAAREWVEIRTSRAFITQTMLLTLDRLPRYSQIGGLQYQSEGLWDQRIPIVELAGRYWPDRAAIRLPVSPVQSVTSITYHAQDGTPTLLDPSLYSVDNTTEPCRITPAYGQIWPIMRQEVNSVQVVFVAGYGDATKVPARVKLAIRLLVGHWYKNRDNTEDVPPGIADMVRSLWIGEMP